MAGALHSNGIAAAFTLLESRLTNLVGEEAPLEQNSIRCIIQVVLQIWHGQLTSPKLSDAKAQSAR